ncbi:MAG: helix-turn-helix domain-containing protein, partial [Pseudonocardia sp.]
PRGLTVLLEGADATVEAIRGGFKQAARRLAGLAAATVPPDMLAPELWGDLVVAVVAAGGDDGTARAMLGAHTGRPATRQQLLTAWLDMRAGRLAQARDGLTAAARTRVLRRNAVLAAAVTMGIARRCGDSNSIASTWHRVAPVVAGADVELLLLDAWGELSAGAAWVSPTDRDTLAKAMHAAVVRAGSPAWCVAIDQWWRLERAVIADDAAAAAATAEQLTGLAVAHPGIEASAEGATTWAAVLAGDVNPLTVARTAARIADTGRHWEAAALCKAAAARTADPAAVRKLLGKGRRLRAETTAPGTGAVDGLSDREREVGALVVDGLTQKEIGARLYISPKTVEQHVARIRQKLTASNRAELVAALRRHLRASPSTAANGSQQRGQAVIGSVRGSLDEQAEVDLRPQRAGIVGSSGSAVRPAAHAPAQSRRG